MAGVTCRVEKINIPTYQIAEYDKNPMFLEKRVYQGSSGKVYPHPVCEGVANEKTNQEYTAIFLENDYILVMLLPELGGRVQRLYDKTNGYDAVYYNEVIKPALVGLAGPWISGGIEFNWPQHHRPSTYDPVEYRIEKQESGAVTVWTGEIEKMFHTKGMAGFTVYPDKAYLEVKGQLYNPTDRAQTFLWWANPAVAVNEYTQSIFPPDVNAVMDHGKRDVSTFPIATGTYYKVDYSEGVDISRYKNIPVPTSYMAYHSDYDFIGNYDYQKRAGLIHIADHHISPGKKQWTWGNGDFGKAWDRNLTDENGPYIELMTGMFTDNQPDFTFLKPYEEKNFVQYFMPYKEVGAMKNASTEIVINIEKDEEGICIKAYAPSEQGNIRFVLYNGEARLYETVQTLHPADSFEQKIAYSGSEEGLRLVVVKEGKEILSCKAVEKSSEPIPEPAKPALKPEEIETTEKLYLTAVHLEQYRHATYSPEPYYLEGLRRDATDIRLNLGYGKYLLNKGLYEKAISFLKQAIVSATWKNPNPYDCEPYFYLGVAYKAMGEYEKAFDAFYKATWDEAQQGKAFYQLACISCKSGEYDKALLYVEQSLIRGLHNLKARNLKITLLRFLGRTEEAKVFAEETQKIDPLDMVSKYELALLCEESPEVFESDAYMAVESSLNYLAAGLYGEADALLAYVKKENDPMLSYYRYFYTGNQKYLENAKKAEDAYCFPNRLEDIAILEKAIEAGVVQACYYLGCLLYDKGRYDEAIVLWEKMIAQKEAPQAYRNLSLAYYNKKQDAKKARAAIEKAFALNPHDPRVLFEMDQLYKVCEVPVQERLEKLEQHAELLETRDNLYTEYVTLLNENGQYDKAYNLMMNHQFHPWEGGEGKITAQYRNSLMKKAEEFAENKQYQKAVDALEQALVYPENLGEGKLAGATDNDIYYNLGKLYQEMAHQSEAEKYFEKAARYNGEFSSAMYYNDQPPEMSYFAALAMFELGRKEKAKEIFEQMIHYGENHIEDTMEIEYFAVSLPDFLVYEADLQKKNRLHCEHMISLGKKGKAYMEGKWR